MFNHATPPGQNEPVWTNFTVQQVAAETILACTTANGIPCTTQYGLLHQSGTPSRAQCYPVLQNVTADLIPDICHERHEYIRVIFFWPV